MKDISIEEIEDLTAVKDEYKYIHCTKCGDLLDKASFFDASGLPICNDCLKGWNHWNNLSKNAKFYYDPNDTEVEDTE